MKTLVRTTIISIMQWQARIIIWRYKPRVIAITGSVGKTGTKDAIYTALAPFFHVRKNTKNFNNEIGVPLTIIGCPTGWHDILKRKRNGYKSFRVMLRPFGRYPKWLVLEVGIGKPGDMEELKQWVKPDMVVVSAFGDMPSHVEFFGSREAVWEEEASIIEALKPDGVLVLNRDDERVYALRTMTNARTITFGMHKDSDILLEHYTLAYDDAKRISGFSFHASFAGNSVPVSFSGVVGKSIMYYVGAALAVAFHYQVNMLHAVEVLQKDFEVPRGRSQLIAGIHDSVIIDDSYNSSPPALGLALDVFEQIETKHTKIAVLGDMLELGKFSDEEHQKLGVRVAGVADVLVTSGVRAKQFAIAAEQAGMHRDAIYEFDDARSAGIFLRSLVREGDTILVKGSQGARMERAIKEIMKNSNEAGVLLCRQEKEWLENE